MGSLYKKNLCGLLAALTIASALAGWEDAELIKNFVSDGIKQRGHHLAVEQPPAAPGHYAKGEESNENSRKLSKLGYDYMLKMAGNSQGFSATVEDIFEDSDEEDSQQHQMHEEDDNSKKSKSRKDDDNSSSPAKAPSNSSPNSKTGKTSKAPKGTMEPTASPTYEPTYVDLTGTYEPTLSPTMARTKSAKTSKSGKSSKSAKTAPMTEPPTTEPPTTEPPSTEPPTTVTPTISMMPSEKATTMPSTSTMPTKKETPEPTTSMMPSDPDAPSAPPSSSAMPSPPPTDSMPPSDSPTTPQPTSEPTHSPNLCNKRADIAFAAIEALTIATNETQFPNVTSPDDVKTLCQFTPPPESSANFGCNFLFIPQFGFIEDYTLVFEDLPAATFQAIDLYCECYLGYQLQCANDIPHGGPPTTIEYEITGTFPVPSYSEYIPFSTPRTRADYCVFASIWNGDIEYDDAVLPARVEECGCYWVSEAKDMVSECPGLNLGEFFNT